MIGASDTASAWSLREYDSDRLGPIFGVSDDGLATPQIVRAFLDSPKARVLERHWLLSRRTIGACVDAERMSAAGELLVGPEEYARVHAAVAGRVPITTNVGTVVLPRFWRPAPFIVYGDTASADLEAALAPFLHPPGDQPRPIVVYVFFREEPALPRADKVNALRELANGLTSDAHRLGLLARAHGRDSQAPEEAIDIAAEAGLANVMIEGDPRYEAQDQLFFSGLLAFFPPTRVNDILERAQEARVRVVAKNHLDVETAARTIWAGQAAARSMGVDLAKFGLFPLTLEQQIEVMERVRPWLGAFTPAPAFYVDRPIVSGSRVYAGHELVSAARMWIAGAAAAGADVVLIDSPDRTPAPAGAGDVPYGEDRGRRLLKRADDDAVGVLTFEDLDQIDAAARLGAPRVRIMWAGGVSGRQAFELARRRAFGIFTTSTAARNVAVDDPRSDPALTQRMEPRYLGVLAVRMVIEAGFLSGLAAERENTEVERLLVEAAEPVIADVDARERPFTTTDRVAETPELIALREVLEPAWEDHLFGLAALWP